MKYEGLQVGMKIRKLRKDKGLSIAELSEQVDKSVSHMNMVELGHHKISLDTLYNLMNVFNVDANSILDITEDKQSVVSVDSMLVGLTKGQQEYIAGVVSYMIQNMKQVA